MKNNLNKSQIKKEIKINQANLQKIKTKWMNKIMNKTANSLKKFLMKMKKENKINKFKSKTRNNQWKNSLNNPMKKKSKRNKLKIENSIKEPMEDKITNLKTITLSINKKIMINKIWVKDNKMPKDLVKDKKGLESQFIPLDNNSYKKS